MEPTGSITKYATGSRYEVFSNVNCEPARTIRDLYQGRGLAPAEKKSNSLSGAHGAGRSIFV